MDVLTSETCWALYNEIKKASDIKLVSLYSTIKMKHGSINMRKITLGWGERKGRGKWQTKAKRDGRTWRVGQGNNRKTPAWRIKQNRKVKYIGCSQQKFTGNCRPAQSKREWKVERKNETERAERIFCQEKSSWILVQVTEGIFVSRV